VGHGPNWYKPPVGEQRVDVLTDSSDEASVQYGSFQIRVAARALDAIVVFLCWLFAGFVGGLAIATIGALKMWSPTDVAPDTPTRTARVLVGFALGWLIYHSVCEAIGDATIGKWVCGLRARRVDFSACTFVSAIARNALFCLDFFFIGALLMRSSARRQRLGDTLARTVVVVSRSLPPSRIRSPAIACVIGVSAAVVVYAVTLASVLVMW
jgi:uncharacterized RDD family membrane protein YckC